MGRHSAVIAVVVLVALPSSAFGATVSVNLINGDVVYSAASGELNKVQLSVTGTASGTVAIMDTDAVITAGGVGCVQESDHEVTCSGATRADIYLGDLDDAASLIVLESDSIGVSLTGGGGKDLLTLCSPCLGTL
jgi:hypothetical protein